MGPVEPREGLTEANEAQLAWRSWAGGDARPPVLLIHDIGASMRTWDLVGPIVGRERRVVAVGQRGRGARETPAGEDIEQIVRDHRLLAESLGLRLPVVVGHGSGGAVALAYAGLYPYGLSAAVLVDGGIEETTFAEGSWEFRPADYFDSVACPVTIVLAERSPADEHARLRLARKQQSADAALMGLRRSPDRRLIWFSETSSDIPMQRPDALVAEIEATIAMLDDE